MAIKHKAISENIHKDWNRTVYVRTWFKAASCVQARRQVQNQRTAYTHFEARAKPWDREGA